MVSEMPQGQRKELMGNLYDRDVVAFYGDPKWDARLDTKISGTPVKWTWSGKPGRRILEIKCVENYKRDDLPILLPERCKNLKVNAADGLDVFVNDEFILLQQPDLTAGKTYRIELGTTGS
jgi:zinc protease